MPNSAAMSSLSLWNTQAMVTDVSARCGTGDAMRLFRSSVRRQQLVAAIICVKLAATLPLDGRTARGGRGVLGRAEGTGQTVSGWTGEGGAGGADADDQKRRGGDLDDEFHWRDSSLNCPG